MAGRSGSFPATIITLVKPIISDQKIVSLGGPNEPSPQVLRGREEGMKSLRTAILIGTVFSLLFCSVVGELSSGYSNQAIALELHALRLDLKEYFGEPVTEYPSPQYKKSMVEVSGETVTGETK